MMNRIYPSQMVPLSIQYVFGLTREIPQYALPILWYGDTYRRSTPVPVRAGDFAAAARDGPAPHIAEGAPPMHHILVIDDDALFRDSLATTLRRAGYAVTARADGRDI